MAEAVSSPSPLPQKLRIRPDLNHGVLKGYGLKLPVKREGSTYVR
jgi:hypothetical protein